MKKQLSIFLALILVLMMCAGCGASADMADYAPAEEAADVAGTSTKCCCVAIETVANQLKIVRRSDHIAKLGSLQQDGLDLLEFRRRKIPFSQFQIFLQILIGKAFLQEELQQYREFIAGIQRQKGQFLQQKERPFFDAVHQVRQVAVEVVVDLQHPFDNRSG